jgi:dolichol-phosphate mannosyltransferase
MKFSECQANLGRFPSHREPLSPVCEAIDVWFPRTPPSGYSTQVVVMTFLFAMQFFFTGLLGIYMAKLYTEVKSRPIYIVDSVTGPDDRQLRERML